MDEDFYIGKKFWGCKISNKNETIFTIPDENIMIITNLLLSKSENSLPTRVLLKNLENSNSDYSIISILIPFKKEHSNTAFSISPSQKISLSIDNHSEVHISGYLIQLDDNSIEEEDFHLN